jgi:cyclin A
MVHQNFVCLFSKYEEIYPPDVKEFAYITDDTYTAQQVLRMEHLILKVLTFDVAVPTTNWFCEDFAKSCDADDKLKSLTMVRGFFLKTYFCL